MKKLILLFCLFLFILAVKVTASQKFFLLKSGPSVTFFYDGLDSTLTKADFQDTITVDRYSDFGCTSTSFLPEIKDLNDGIWEIIVSREEGTCRIIYRLLTEIKNFKICNVDGSTEIFPFVNVDDSFVNLQKELEKQKKKTIIFRNAFFASVPLILVLFFLGFLIFKKSQK